MFSSDSDAKDVAKKRPDEGEVQAVHMIKRARTPRSREKQLEKEIPWSMIPESMRPKFREKEMVQGTVPDRRLARG